MSRERVKSFVLICLVMMNFVLGSRILTDKKLWPNGYNFFSSLENINLLKFFSAASEVKNTKTHLAMPQEIIINTGDQTSRIAVNSSEDLFYDIYNAASSCVAKALSAEARQITLSQKSEWVSVLNGQSVCFNYPVRYDTRLFGEFYNTNSAALSFYVPALSRIVISQDKSVFFEDYASGSFYKVGVESGGREIMSLINKAKSVKSTSGAIINYSVDLKFDEAIGNQKAVLSPTVPVYSTPVKVPVLNSSNPLTDENGGLNKGVTEKILSLFKINPNTVRRYTEVSGTVVFVENNGILKIHPSGLLQYQSTASSGFSLSPGGSYTESISALADFADKLSAACALEQELYISGPVVSPSENVTFDYRSGGIPININIGTGKHAISAEIKNGYMTSYEQYIKNYFQGSETYYAPLYIEALDSAIENYSKDMNNIEIRAMYLVYNDDNTEAQKDAVWKTEVKSIDLSEEEKQ